VKTGLKSLFVIGIIGTIVIAVMGLLGYVPGLGVLGAAKEGYIPMAPSTATSFIVMGIVLLILPSPLSKAKIIISLLAVFVVALFGALEVAGHFSGMDLNFEDRLVPFAGELDGVPIARMSPATGAAFFFAGIAVLLLVAQRQLKYRNASIKDLAGLLGTLVLIVSFVFCLAYFYGTPLLYGQGSTVPMALTTALGFLFLSVSILACEKETFPLRLLTGNSTTSYLLRFILPFSVLLVLLIGFAEAVLSPELAWNPALLLAIHTVLAVVLSGLVALLLSRHMGSRIDQADAALKATNDALQRSEERWQFALEGSRDGVWDWNVKTNEVFFSSRWKEMLGFKDGEIANKFDEWQKRVHPDDWEQVLADIEEHFDHATPYYENEHRVLCKDGSYKWILDRGKVVSWTKDNKPLRMIGTHTDVTERNQAKEALRQQLQLNKTITDNAASCLFMMDKQGHTTFMNPAAEQVTGYTLDEIRDMPLHDAVHYKYPDGSPYPMSECPIDNAQAELVAMADYEDIFVRKDGGLFPVVCYIAPLEQAGEVVGSVLEFRDVTEQKHAEEALRTSEARYARAVRGTRDGLWDWNVLTNEDYLSPRWKELLGFTEDELVDHYDTFFSRVHPADTVRVQAAIQAHLEQRVPYDIEHRLRTKNDDYR